MWRSFSTSKEKRVFAAGKARSSTSSRLQQNTVLATGGGAVIDAYNRECMKTRGIAVYLRASVDRLFTRTRRDINRPLLQTADPKRTLQELLRHRDPLYREVADLVINTDGRTLRQVITEIRHFVEQR